MEDQYVRKKAYNSKDTCFSEAMKYFRLRSSDFVESHDISMVLIIIQRHKMDKHNTACRKMASHCYIRLFSKIEDAATAQDIIDFKIL